MVFTEDSQMVKSMILLIVMGIITVDEVPNLANLKVVVEQVLTK